MFAQNLKIFTAKAGFLFGDLEDFGKLFDFND